jgi:hypothetical protein
LVSTISQLNTFINLFGNCAANVPELCYRVNPSDTAHSCYQVVLPNAATLIVASPDTIAIMTSSTHQCQFTYLPNSSTEAVVWLVGMPDLGCTINSAGVLTTDNTTGRVWVYATGTRGCQEDSILVEITAPIGVRALPSTSLAIEAMPMPFEQYLLLELEVQAGIYQLELVDVAGRVVHQAQRRLARGVQQWRLSTEALSVGVYVLRVQGAAEQGSLLVVKR